MKEEVIGTKEIFKTCFFTGCLATLVLLLALIGYLIYIFFFDDSLAS